jgi:hypothetical protein
MPHAMWRHIYEHNSLEKYRPTSTKELSELESAVDACVGLSGNYSLGHRARRRISWPHRQSRTLLEDIIEEDELADLEPSSFFTQGELACDYSESVSVFEDSQASLMSVDEPPCGWSELLRADRDVSMLDAFSLATTPSSLWGYPTRDDGCMNSSPVSFHFTPSSSDPLTILMQRARKRSRGEYDSDCDDATEPLPKRRRKIRWRRPGHVPVRRGASYVLNHE